MVSVALAFLLISAPRVDKDVVFSEVGSEKLKMDIYYPEKENSVHRGIIVIHGGAWMTGVRQDMAALSQGLANQGFVAATIDYRLAPKDKWPAMLDDCQTAVRYLRAKAKSLDIDPEKIGSTGASAGGHLAMLLGFRDTVAKVVTEYPNLSSRTQCVFNLFGPVDLSKDFPKYLDYVYEKVTGKKREDAAELIHDASPINFIDAKSAPVFTMQGKADPLVPFKQAERLEEALKKANVPSDTRFIPGMGHEVKVTIPECEKALKDGVDWFKKYLVGPNKK